MDSKQFKFKKSIKAINETKDLDLNFNKKLILGILDNLRNFILVYVNAHITSKFSEKTAILRINKEQDGL